MSTNVIEASGLGKRYGGTWALHDCTLAIPAGHVAALVGPNGAGKTTLLNLAAGLAVPSAGVVTVLGGRAAGSPTALDGIAFVAQDTPLYKNLSVADMLHLTRNLNRHFDQPYARARLDELGIPLKRKAGKLSGGQQAQLALTLALARRPRLLILDEPVAMLDPIARHDFMATVMTAMAADGVSVVLSSHVLAELERVADYLIVLSRGQGGAPADRGVRRGAGAGPGAGDRHLPVRLDPGLRPVALDARQADAARDRARRRRRGVQPAAGLVLPAVLRRAANQNPGLEYPTPFFPGLFDLRGIGFAAWALTAFTIGALAGILIRRVVPAIAATLVAYAGLSFAAGGFLRQHYIAPVVTSSLNVPGSAWIIGQWWAKGGTFAFAGGPPDSLLMRFCPNGPSGPVGPFGKSKPVALAECLTSHGYTQWTSYQPESRFWPFLWIEGGWLLVLSALLIAATVWLIRRRAA